METSKPFQSFSAFSKRTRYLPGRYLVRLKHKDQTPICRKCSRPGHQTGTWPDTFLFYYPNSLQHFSDFPNLLMGILKLCLHSSLRSFLINHHTVPRILIVQANCRLTSSCCNLLRKPCCLPRLSHKLNNSLQVVLRHCSSFLLFCAIGNASCYRFFFAAFIWLDSGYIQIIRPWARRSRFTWTNWTVYR